MGESTKRTMDELKSAGKAVMEKVDVERIKGMAATAAVKVAGKAVDVKDSAVELKDDIEAKLTELDRMLEQSITDYNDAFTQMNDKGLCLFVERSRAVDTIGYIERLINSLANRPKSFEDDFAEIDTHRQKFADTCDFANREIQAAREAAGGVGAGLAAGATVAFMGPTAAMWIATTFGTASTGAAISTLSGAAATNAALAWLGGGAAAAGGGGMAAGNALLALAGPIGWTIAGASLLTSIVLFARKKNKLNKEKNEEIEQVKENTERVMEMSSQLAEILMETCAVRDGVGKQFLACLELYGSDYSGLDEEKKLQLGALVNNTKALSKLFERTLAV